MSAVDHLRAIARGAAAPDDGLLGNARCGWGKSELIGEESILAAFCADPFVGDDALAVETDASAAIIGKDDALIADVYDGRIGRLWRVGRGLASPDEPAVHVAFDPDMRQLRGDVHFRAEDHPELDASGAERLLAAARSHVDQVRRAGALRARAFVVRAFGDGERGAGLLSVYAMSNASARSVGFSHAVVGFAPGVGDAVVVAEHSPPQAWTPRF